MKNKSDLSKKILKILSEKPIIGVSDIKDQLMENGAKYAITRSLKGLEESGMIESLSSGRQKDYARLTKEGKKKVYSLKLENDTTLVNPNWDGFWRIIILDLPEERKNEREALRYLLKKAGFICLKNSIWISNNPYEHMFINIKKDLGLKTEMMILVTEKLDTDTEQEFFNLIKRTMVV